MASARDALLRRCAVWLARREARRRGWDEARVRRTADEAVAVAIRRADRRAGAHAALSTVAVAGRPAGLLARLIAVARLAGYGLAAFLAAGGVALWLTVGGSVATAAGAVLVVVAIGVAAAATVLGVSVEAAAVAVREVANRIEAARRAGGADGSVERIT
jgi:hypothetical protein